MAERTCPFCGAVTTRKLFCVQCLPPYGEWPDKRAYHQRYQLLYRACGMHGSGDYPRSRLPATHPARMAPLPMCGYCGAVIARNAKTCVACRPAHGRARSIAWHRANHQQSLANQRAWRTTIKGGAYRLRHRSSGKRRILIARDGKRCALCGKRINARLTYPHPMSASVDHIVPSSLGGTNDMANLQLAHLQCNIDKGTTPQGEQLRLIG